MAQFRRVSNGQIVTLGSAPLYTGGEGAIYECYESRDLIAKIYKNPTIERSNKLLVMTANPPNDPMISRGHTSIAWPSDLLRTDNNKTEIAGFLMPKIDGARQIFEFYNPKKRRTICPSFNFRYLLRTAKNLVSAFGALHDHGYIVGDVNELNILVTNTALVTLIDTDSFQVRDPNMGTIWRCLVGKADFTPPELQGRNLSHIDRSQQHDLFGLSVINFLLLMEGNHPFNARYLGQGEPKPREERISLGIFPYSSRSNLKYIPPPHAPSFKTIDPILQYLFRRCFDDGHNNPRARPTTKEWAEGLEQAEQNLVSCRRSPIHHWYGKHLTRCPWCERTLKYKQDPFSPLSLNSAKPTNTYQRPLPPISVQPPPQPTSTRRAISAVPSSTRASQHRNPSASHWSWSKLFIGLVTGVLVGIIMFIAFTIIELQNSFP